MLNGSIVTRDSAGRFRNLPAGSFPIRFNGGTPTGDLGGFLTASTVPTVFVGGLGYNDAGAICIAVGGTIAQYSTGGLPLDSVGRLVVSNAQPVAWQQNSVPFDAAGRVALATPETAVNLHAFDLGFDQGAFD